MIILGKFSISYSSNSLEKFRCMMHIVGTYLPKVVSSLIIMLVNDHHGLFFVISTQRGRKCWLRNWQISQFLSSGVDDELKIVKRWPLQVRNLPQSAALEKYLRDFKKSVALFVELKHDALRERHWKELMEKTGRCLHLFLCGWDWVESSNFKLVDGLTGQKTLDEQNNNCSSSFLLW